MFLFIKRTTLSDEIITKMSEVLPSPHSRRVSFEIYANARNQPMVPYQPVVMHMRNQGVVELTKIVTTTNKVTEIEWVSLDRYIYINIYVCIKYMTNIISNGYFH